MRLADGLGVASVALGAPMLLAPRRSLAIAGIRCDTRAIFILAGVGLREFSAAVTILGMRHRRVGAWSRVVGDTMDLTLLAMALRTRRENPPRLLGSIAFIGLIFATDLYTAVALNHAEGVGTPDGAMGDGRGAQERPGPLRVRTAITILAPEAEVRSAFTARQWSAFDPCWLEESGQGWFVPSPGDRGVELHIDFEPEGNGGALKQGAMKLLGHTPEQEINDQLRRFKVLLEAGVEVRSDDMSESVSSRRRIIRRPGRRPSGDGPA